jgi:hypothetical protein
MKHRMIRPS